MSQNSNRTLPNGFEELEPFVEKWAKPTSGERIAARCTSEMPDIRGFYEVMLNKADEAMDTIQEHPLNDMPPEVQKLSQLLLALAQASIAVEVHKAPRAPNTPFPNSIKVVRGFPPFG